MPTITDILERKGGQVTTVEPTTLVIDAATMMNDAKIGAVVVVQAGKVVGMFTERDVLRRVVAERVDPATVTVADVMTKKIVSCNPDTRIEVAQTTFMEKRIRHLPVIDSQGQLRGLVSIGDLNAYELSGHQVRVQALEEYLYGGAA